MVSYAKYSLVPTEAPNEEDEAEHHPSAFDYSSAFNYKSAFNYNNSSSEKKKKNFYSVMNCITNCVIGLSYVFICLTLPITIWFCMKKTAQWERLIVFRLGHLRGALGPGTVFIIPWLDRYTRVDMRTKAFSVPPQQLITADNGIIEMGCEVKYRVSDVQRLTTTVTSPQHGLRSFGKTVLLNVLTKHTVRETERDRPIIAAEVQKELNTRVLEWGIEIGDVDLSTVNILKDAEPNNPLKSVISAFGDMSSSDEPGNPLASVASSLVNSVAVPRIGQSFTQFSNFGLTSPDTSKKKSEDMGNLDLLDLSEDGATVLMSSCQQHPVTGSSSPHTKLGKYLQSLVASSGAADLTHGIYRLQVDDIQAGGIYIIFIGNGVRQVVEGDLPKVTPDVSVTLSKDDLYAILGGSLPPLQAYLSGHLSVQGNIQMLMGLEALRQSSSGGNGKDDVFIV